jgi:probable HAF family extracellular repeat protein
VAVPAAAAAAGQHRITLTELGFAGAANAINERGQITGRVQITPGSFLPVHAFLRTAGQMRDLGVLGGDFSEGVAVNDRGHVVGESSMDGSFFYHAALWRDGQIIDLGEGRALGINNHDQVVGIAIVDGHNRAFVWENGTRTLLDTPADADSQAVAINDRGDIVGSVIAGRFQPVRWRHGVAERLPVPASAFGADASDVNELGQVLITTSEDAGNEAYILTGSRLRRSACRPARPGFSRPR